MNKNKIVGRAQEINLLEGILNSPRPELLAVYGRRRVGKSFLITEFFGSRSLFFEIVGAKKESEKIKLKRFHKILRETFGPLPSDSKKSDSKRTNDWDGAFETLLEVITSMTKKQKQQKIVLFFDELPWLSEKKSRFLTTLEYYWNKYFSRSEYKNVKIVVCGSSASWMIKKVINNKAGLHNRLTQTIRLQPFTLSEVELYFKSKNIHFSRKNLIDLYMTIGGVPKYLTYITGPLSISEITEQLIFDKHGPLYEEFDNLYSSLFDDYHKHLAVIKALAEHHYGLSLSKLLAVAHLPVGGSSLSIIRELEASGFIMTIPFYKKEKKETAYRLVDEYSLFYLKWVKKNAASTSRRMSWHQVVNSASYKSWAGYNFENVVIKHLVCLKKALGISDLYTHVSYWCNRKAQIDLLIERADQIIHVCEIKFSASPLSPTALQKEFNLKCEEFTKETQPRATLLKTLISLYGVDSKTQITDRSVILDGLFG